MAELAGGARTGTRAVLQTTPEAAHWPALERELGQWVRQARDLDAVSLEARSVALLRRVDASIARVADGPHRQRAFRQCITSFDNARSAWLTFAPADTVARHLYAVLVWYGAWHVLAAGLPVAELRRIIPDPSPTGGTSARPAPAQTAHSLRTIRSARPVPVAKPVAMASHKAAAAARAGHIVKAAAMSAAQALPLARTGFVKARNGLAAWAAARAKAMAEASEHRAQANADRQAQLRRSAELARQRRQPAQPSIPGRIAMQSLDGRALRTSVFGTWLALVLFSWVSLLWGLILSAPFGVGRGLIVTGIAGIIAVPVWGTFWGFLGMEVARSATLRKMGFDALPDGHPLAQTCQAYCTHLQIPVPKLGTFRAFNAFAMGVDHHNATVAIGEPLLAKLTPDEVAAILGHELGHVVSGDMRRMMLMRTFQNATVWFAMSQGLKQFVRWIICWAAELWIKAFSRNREYWADAVGAALAGKEAMIGALRKLEQGPPLTAAETRHARFMFRGPWHATHPATADRIRALETEKYLRRLPQRRAA